MCYTGVFPPFLFVLFEACSLATSDTHRGLSSAGNLPLDETTRATAAAAPFTHLNFAALGGSGFFIMEGEDLWYLFLSVPSTVICVKYSEVGKP